MSSKHIHHLNYLVKDMHQATGLFNTLFQQVPVIENLQGRNVTTARYDLSGTYFVLVQPLSENGPVAEILRQRGEGVFLISFSVDNLSQALDNLEKEGIEVARETSREGLDGWKICDFGANQLQNIVLQLCQHNKEN